MHRNRWAPIAAAVAVVAVVVVVVLIGVSLRSDDGGAPGPPGAGSRQPFAFDAAYTDVDPNVLVVRYGDSGSCPSLAVRHGVVEQPDRVVVTLTRTPMPTDRACTSDYQAKLVRVALAAPLGSRVVVDGSRNAPVPVSKGSPPFG